MATTAPAATSSTEVFHADTNGTTAPWTEAWSALLTTMFVPAPDGVTGDAAALINSTIDADLLFWSMTYSSIGVGLAYVILSCSFFVYIHAVHRKKTLKPWMKRNASRLRRESSGAGKAAIEMIDIKISGTVAGKEDARTVTASEDHRMAVGRLRVCREIVSTEASYCKVINQIVDFYLARLKTSFKYDPILPKGDVDVVFMHCESLQKLHQTLLEKIDSRALAIKLEAEEAAHAAVRAASRGSGRHRSRGTPEDERVATDAILQLESLDFVFDCFSEMIPFFRVYTAFCNNFDVAQAKIHECLDTRPKFFKFIERCRNDADFTGLDLEDLLIQPVQRICRYPLLFDEALKNMLTTHPQYEKLTAVNDAMKGIAAEVDRAREVAKNTKILHALHSDVVDSRVRPLKFSDTDFIIPSRWFIRRFDAHFEDRFEPRALQPCSVFVFNDLVLLTTQKLLRRESTEDDDREQVQLVAEYTLPMSGLKVASARARQSTPYLRSRAAGAAAEGSEQEDGGGGGEGDGDGGSELKFTCSVNLTKKRAGRRKTEDLRQTAVFKFSVVLETALEAQMVCELLGELQTINHRNEAKKSELGGLGKKSWVRQKKQEYLDNRADTTEAKSDGSNSIHLGTTSSAGFDVIRALKQLRDKYNRHVADVYDDAVNTPREHTSSASASGGDDDDSDADEVPTAPPIPPSADGAGGGAAKPPTPTMRTRTEGAERRPQPAPPGTALARPQRAQPVPPGGAPANGDGGGGGGGEPAAAAGGAGERRSSKSRKSVAKNKKNKKKNKNGKKPPVLEQSVVSVLRTILDDPYLTDSNDGTQSDPQYLAVRNAVEDKLGRKLDATEKRNLQKELLNRRMTRTAKASYADKV